MNQSAVTQRGVEVETELLPVVLDDENAELEPARHFHRDARARSLTAGPLANPRRTRLG